MKHFFIYSNKHKDENMQVTNRIKKFLEARGIRCTVCAVDVYQRKNLSPEEEIRIEVPEDADVILVLGGDGTMLQAARDTMYSHLPLIGINLGTLGYMAEIEQCGIEDALQKIAAGDFISEKRMMLTGKVRKQGKFSGPEFSLNDIVLSGAGPMQMIRLNVYVNGHFLNMYSADGMIISTPTGSTGYNLSAGGPIVEPGANLILLTPVCPHMLCQRSIVLSPADRVRIEVPENKEEREQIVETRFDGSHAVKLTAGDWIDIAQSDQSTEILKLNQVSFLENLHKKMSES